MWLCAKLCQSACIYSAQYPVDVMNTAYVNICIYLFFLLYAVYYNNIICVHTDIVFYIGFFYL
jgi:hypothetical protein